MTTPLILGNDFADQYSLSIECNDRETTLHFANTGRTLKLGNTTSDSHMPTEVKTFLATIRKKRHKISNHLKKSLAKKKLTFTVEKNETIAPFTSKLISIKIPWIKDLKEVLLEPTDKIERRLSSLQFLDSLVKLGQNHIMVINPTDCPTQVFKEDILGMVIDPVLLDKQVDPLISKEVLKFANHTEAILHTFKKTPEENKEELEHTENQPEQPSGPKMAEVPEFEDIPEELSSSLDINPKLNPNQRKQLEKVLIKNHVAFSLDRRIGKYEGIQYEIKLEEDAKPVL